MKLNLQNLSLTIGGYVSRCHCRCSHCLLSSGSKGLPYISYTELKELSEEFVGFRDKYNIHTSMAVNSSCEFEELADSMVVNKRLNFTHAGYLNLNGTAIRKGNELIEWVRHLKEIGMTNANISWFGIKDTHDTFVHKKGYYEYLINLSETLQTEGILFSNSIFITRSNIAELDKLIGFLSPLGGNNGYSIPNYRGYAKNLQTENLIESDIGKLPRDIIDSGAMSDYISEHEWVNKVRQGDYPILSKRSLFMVARTDNLQEYMRMSWDEVLSMFDRIDLQLQETIPSFEFLAQNYGDEKSELLYNFM